MLVKSALVTLGLLVVSSPSVMSAKPVAEVKPIRVDGGEYTPMRARITYYHRFQDKFGNKVAMDTHAKAVEGVTVAAHPVFKFGTRVYIPELRGVVGSGEFTVQDRGSAVTAKQASKYKTFVFDIYVEAPSRKCANRRLKHLSNRESEYMTVYVPKGEI